jgi:ABC-type glutathione transport system ATPase component
MELQTFKRLRSDDDDDIVPALSVVPLVRPDAARSAAATSSSLHSISIPDDDSKEDGAARSRSNGRLSPDVQTDANGNIVVATNIHKTYLLGVEGVPALRGVSLSIKRGEFIMILGSSGGGKVRETETETV